jgi:hypothetical protein
MNWGQELELLNEIKPFSTNLPNSVPRSIDAYGSVLLAEMGLRARRFELRPPSQELPPPDGVGVPPPPDGGISCRRPRPVSVAGEGLGERWRSTKD